jgi:hypothetical protein
MEALEYWMNIQYSLGMTSSSSLPQNVWIAACAHELAKRWKTVDPEQLEGVAEDLAHDEHLRGMPPDQAAVEWLRPISSAQVGR